MINDIIVVPCYSDEPEFDEFLDFTDEEVKEFGERNERVHSLLEFQQMMNADDFVFTNSFVRFVLK